MKTVYSKQFFEGTTETSAPSAAVIVPIINEIVTPTSVLDVGCGSGDWLVEWQTNGVEDVVGLDGEYARPELRIEPSKFIATNLEQPFSLGRTFNLVQCLEVGEHLTPSIGTSFVKCIAEHGDTVFFGAAVPGQRGTHHINEQWQSYWAERFMELGYTVFDVVRPRIWDDGRVAVWYRQNALIFSRSHVFAAPPTPLAYFDRVHPELWESRREPSLTDFLRERPGIRPFVDWTRPARHRLRAIVMPRS